MKAGHHILMAFNEGKGTIRIRRTADKPNDRIVHVYPTTPIRVFDDDATNPDKWPAPEWSFTLAAHEVDCFAMGLRKR